MRRLLACCCSHCGALWKLARSRPRSATGRTGEVLTYASPVEMVFSPDGARLYVLCQGSEEVRVLDAATYAAIKSIPVGRVPRGILALPRRARASLSPTRGTTRSRSSTRKLWP